MENSMSRFITGSVVKRTLKDIKDNPERSIRNLVDMALQFSGGRFQQDFFTTAQTMLQNEKINISVPNIICFFITLPTFHVKYILIFI